MPKSNSLRVVITGANGFVAKNVRSHLHKNGVNLITISRKNFLNLPSERKIISSNFDQNNIYSHMKNYDALVHLIGRGRQTSKNSFEDVNVNLTKKAVNLCKKSKIKKIIFISGLGVTKDSTSAYFISKYKAEQKIIKSGLNYTIFRASYIIGNNDPLSKNLKNQIKNGTIIIPGSGKYHLQPIFVQDVSEVILNAIISKSFSKKIIDLVGPELITFEEFVKVFKNKHKAKIKKIDLEKAYYEALHNPQSFFGLEDLNIMIGDFKGDHKKLMRLSGLKFKKFKEVLKTSSLA